MLRKPFFIQDDFCAETFVTSPNFLDSFIVVLALIATKRPEHLFLHVHTARDVQDLSMHLHQLQ